VNVDEFDYVLPPELIAQVPALSREGSRLLVYHRDSQQLEHRHFVDLPQYLRPNDVLVLNDSKVVRARLRGHNAASGGAFELLLLEENTRNDWWVMLRPGRRARVGTRIQLHNRQGQPTSVTATVVDLNPEGHRRVQFAGTDNLLDVLDELGEMPVPPYIERHLEAEKVLDEDRYQTVYANAPGSVAAPTAGLHFTTELLEDMGRRGIQTITLTLHVGLGTFAPVKAETVETHLMHEERFTLSKSAVGRIQEARARGGRVIPVGTTSLRTLESVARAHGEKLVPGEGRTRLFIYPPADFHVADALITNFHLPRSTLLMLVSAFAAPGRTTGTPEMLRCYDEAIRQGYRFFSYGDAMLIL